MNTLKTVYGKLFKEETQLASHEVELALADNLMKLVNGNKTAISEASRYIDNVKVTWQKLNAVKDDIDDMRSYIKSIPSAKNALSFNNQELNKILSQIELQAKELGLDAKNVKGYLDAQKEIEKNNEFIKQLDFQKSIGEKVLSELK
jgi:regulator of replication initiation timing